MKAGTLLVEIEPTEMENALDQSRAALASAQAGLQVSRSNLDAAKANLLTQQATVIAYGNGKESYREVKLGRGKGRPQKPNRPREPSPGSTQLVVPSSRTMVHVCPSVQVESSSGLHFSVEAPASFASVG